jgi:EAL domain-containing protein (putative c-di-GMP-specific phosphodiesterase class I)
MPLQQLVEYFNDRLEQEHNSQQRPFVLEDNRVYGIFGPIQVGSQTFPIRKALQPSLIAGYVAQLSVTANPCRHLTAHEAGFNLLDNEPSKDTETIINFDRLTRTVHMLNYLPNSHLDDLLIMSVDPRHILGVKKDHGAYFEEIIIKCGLKTHNVAISLNISAEFALLYPSLVKGLHNYQKRGYKIALKFDYASLEKPSSQLISRVLPDFVTLSAEHLDTIRDNRLPEKLVQFTQFTASLDGRSIMLDIHEKRSAALARQMGFDLVQGFYFEQQPAEFAYEQTTFSKANSNIQNQNAA